MSSDENFHRCKDAPVENTNSESLLSKFSLVERGYRPDPFLRLFVNPVGNKPIRCRRSPAINRGYLTRLLALEHSFEKYVLLSSSLGQKFQVLSLGAGYDTTYFRLRNSGIIDERFCNYFEVDFPIVANTKCRKITDNKLCRSFFSKYEAFENSSCYKFDNGEFCLIGCNMTDTEKLEQKMTELGFVWDRLTIVLTECSTTYVDVDLSLQLLRWMTAKVSNFIFVDYEQIRPFDHFGQIMKRHFSNRGSPLKCIDSYPTTADHYHRFMNLCWTDCRIQTIDQIVRQYFNSSEKYRIRRFVDDPFDEIEELQLKCSHYILIVGSKFSNQKLSIPYDISNTEEKFVNLHDSLTNWRLHNTNYETLARFGHSMANSENNLFFIGGYSKSKQRDNIFVSVKKESGNWDVVNQRTFPSDQILFSGLASTSRCAFVFGGRASPKEPSDKMFKIDFESENISEILTSGPRPTARWKHTLTAVSEDRLVLVGGKDDGQIFDEIYIFDCKEQKWNLEQRLPHGLHSHSAALHDGKLLLSGGLDEDGNILQHFYTFDWNQIEGTSSRLTRVDVSGFIGRFSHTSHLIRGDQLVLVGGVSNAQEPGIGIVDLKSKMVREYTIELITLEAPLTLHTSYVEDDVDGRARVFTFGGGTNCFSFGMHVNKSIIEIQLPL